MRRRDFVKGSLAGLAALNLPRKLPQSAPYISNSALSRRVIVLGMDGVDPVLLKRFVAEGGMPNFERFMREGHSGEMQTTMPPHSPVAWSSFITGLNPGGHGIFDFVHRDVKSFEPYMSTSRSYDAERTFSVGKYKIPLGSGRVELLRKAPAFWNTLASHGIESNVFQVPADFPAEPGGARTISGMGTPDLLGTYGTFTLFSDVPIAGSEHMSGGRVERVRLRDHAFKATLNGPPNSLRADRAITKVPIEVVRDPSSEVARIRIGAHELILKQGEWSEWLPISFELLPMFASLAGMVRLYLQQVHPDFRLYVTPINVDPLDPALPICTPGSFSREVSQVVGRFHTQGFPTDNKALSTGVFSDEEFLVHAHHILDEQIATLEYQLSNFKEGFLFHYFSSIDQNSHMMWRTMDPSHPQYRPDASDEVKGALKRFYQRMDDALGRVLPLVDNRTSLFVMSDHGFTTFTRELNLNTWLFENGFLALKNPESFEQGEFFDQVDWSKTKAFGLGINGLYLNLKDRERYGSLDPKQADTVKTEIQQKLGSLRDPQNGKPMITSVYDARAIYHGAHLDLGPDLVVGYQSGFRVSDESVLGGFPREVVRDRTDKWSADHCLDPMVVPGVVVSNRAITAPQVGLWDMAPTILKAFGLEPESKLDGKVVFDV